MAAPAPQTPSGDDRNLVTVDENYLAPSFEDRLQIFWEKHGRTVIAVSAVIAVALVGRWLMGVYIEQREQAIRADYAAASSPAELQAFIAANPRAPLAGVASLRLADEAYLAGDFTAAREAYAAAVPLLGNDPLASRARLGAAMAPLQAGDVATAKGLLEDLANDTTLATTLRGESAYHLAVLARDAGEPSEAMRWTTLTLSVDPEGMWAQRALQLRGSLPAEAVATGEIETSAAGESGNAEDAPMISLPVLN